jgi:hypothetical protein
MEINHLLIKSTQEVQKGIPHHPTPNIKKKELKTIQIFIIMEYHYANQHGNLCV